ncbi:DNA-binding transcriptional regulator, GntR family [Enhydrobacter aerosaccus]|uniref:DNA-binding transcriptional regulator, GntR family n=1 Tax=Enhydrobacter aerosaccus TaxID=225324 RepID=A0A1T4TEN8_9HYPH|nr:GntR family transcriptional regulator [Enhydrobacter aerosaccus]SKA38917.1 DNA-binding transcriptional regulator, GntR family [Enhydrobacter aerosaccus]
MVKPTNILRLDRERQAAPQVFERLREKILSLALPPGTTLSRLELAAQFGLSATPIRDALMRLDEEGLVEVFPQHATVVSRIDVKAAQQAHFLRQALELEIVRQLADQHGDGLIPELERTLALQQQFAKAGDFAQFMAADNEFHRQLYAAADKLELWNLVRSRSGHIDRLRRLHLPTPGKAQDIVRHHRLIMRAIAASRPDEAQQHLRKHLSGTLGYLEQIRERYPDYLDG